MKKINDHQKAIYEDYEHGSAERFLTRYSNQLANFIPKKDIQILDIGGGSGYFAYLLKKYFNGNAEIYVIDTCEYDSWRSDALGNDVHFICDSVENVDTLFHNHKFDIVFVNRAFHHFVDSSWRKTLLNMEKHMVNIQKILKKDGFFLIMDHFYDGIIFDSAASFIIYTLTSLKNPLLIKLFKKFGAKSSGVGVCFQSEKMWIKRIKNSNLSIESIDYGNACDINPLKKICLLCKKITHDNIMIIKPKNDNK